MSHLISDSKSYHFRSRLGASGKEYLAGFYDAPAADVTLTIGGTVTQNLGSANLPYSAHAFIVVGATSTMTGVLTVSGTSITDAGVRTPGDSQVIVANTDTPLIDTYHETPKKWVGQITYTLTGASGAFTFNYGWAKYEDFRNRDFNVTDFECVWLGGAADTGFDIELLHHKEAGWTYDASAFVPGNGALYQMSSVITVEKNLAAGEPGNCKRTDLDEYVNGHGSEGVLIRITTGANGALDNLDAHIGVRAL